MLYKIILLCITLYNIIAEPTSPKNSTTISIENSPMKIDKVQASTIEVEQKWGGNIPSLKEELKGIPENTKEINTNTLKEELKGTSENTKEINANTLKEELKGTSENTKEINTNTLKEELKGTPENTKEINTNTLKEELKGINAKRKIDQIHLILQYADAETLRKYIPQIKYLPVEEQKLYIQELRDLFLLSDILVKVKVLDLIASVTWNDLDNDVISILNTPSTIEINELFFAALNAVENKKIVEGYPILKKLIEDIDLSKSNIRFPDMLRIFGKIKDTSLGDFMFEKLQNTLTLNDNKPYILQYLIAIEYKTEKAIQYFQENIQKEDLDIKMRAAYVKAVGLLNIETSKDILKNILNTIDQIVDPDKKNAYRILRLAILNTLIRFKDELAEKIILSLSRDDDPQTRIKALQELNEINADKYKKLIEYKAQYDPNPLVQKKAKSLLDKKTNYDKQLAEQEEQSKNKKNGIGIEETLNTTEENKPAVTVKE